MSFIQNKWGRHCVNRFHIFLWATIVAHMIKPSCSNNCYPVRITNYCAIPYLLRTESVVLLIVEGVNGRPWGLSTVLLATQSKLPLSVPLSWVTFSLLRMVSPLASMMLSWNHSAQGDRQWKHWLFCQQHCGYSSRATVNSYFCEQHYTFCS